MIWFVLVSMGHQGRHEAPDRGKPYPPLRWEGLWVNWVGTRLIDSNKRDRGNRRDSAVPTSENSGEDQMKMALLNPSWYQFGS